jgi:hypothetical protein
MTTRKYSSRSQQTTLTSPVTAGALTMVVGSGSALLGGATVTGTERFTVVIDPDTALEEIVDVSAVSTNTFTIARGIENAGTGQIHSAGAVVRHMVTGRDLREANLHIEATGAYNDGTATHTLHGIDSAEGSVVGTDKAQTLTAKTLTSPIITSPTITAGAGAEFTSITFEGTTADTHETTLTVIDPTADRTIELPNASGRIVLIDTTDTLTNKTLTSPIISGTPVITGLSSAGMSSSSAVPLNYVDSILGSATAASTSATSAAASALAATTSATSASASAGAAATSATSASNSASAASTSAASALTSQTAAATSATSASNSAGAAATSATSAAASAVSAANSVATIATYADNAATSATSAAASALAATTSATSASNSATASASSASAAATSATSAAASATAAAASYDSFDDRYLGSKASDPTLDNDGNALITGALYFNSVVGALKVYGGASWALVAPDTSNFIDKTILTAKGSIISASTASTPVALTVAATDGYVLSVSSAAASGLAWVAANPGDITGVTAGTGLTGGGTSGSVTLNLDTTGVAAGTYTLSTITVDVNGRITSASTGVAAGETFNPLLLMGA